MKYAKAVLLVLFKLWVVVTFCIGWVIGFVITATVHGAIAGSEDFTKVIMKVEP